MIREVLEELARELDGEGVRGEIFLVGGAAMALAYATRRSTADLDAIFEPTDVVRRAAQRIAARRGLEPDWLNDAVKGFLPGDDPNALVALDVPGLRVRVASPRYLLAMKLLASRVERDEDDIRALLRLCGIQRSEDARDVVEDLYGPRPVDVRVQFLLRELLGESIDPSAE